MIRALDHLVLTVRDLAATEAFYCDGLGMELRTFRGGRRALHFGTQKINLHEAGREVEPKAARPTPGSADLCLLTDLAMDDVLARLTEHDIAVIEGPAERTGAEGPILSVYLRDPDDNLIEISRRL